LLEAANCGLQDGTIEILTATRTFFPLRGGTYLPETLSIEGFTKSGKRIAAITVGRR
jgi:hypothetical protein